MKTADIFVDDNFLTAALPFLQGYRILPCRFFVFEFTLAHNGCLING
jgi:hypothetical protein